MSTEINFVQRFYLSLGTILKASVPQYPTALYITPSFALDSGLVYYTLFSACTFKFDPMFSLNNQGSTACTYTYIMHFTC